MAEKRKLLGEIDKCFKKIDEGVEEFEVIMQKMQDANSENQRDKYQDDLKREIKKLQRLRDSLKGWQNNPDIKDKDKLTQYRRLIEHRMEQFKDIERENKTKPHSKVGLCAEEKVDPKEREKAETTEWLQNMITDLEAEVDRTEALIEGQAQPDVSTKKGRKGKDDFKKSESAKKLDDLKKHHERMKFHIQQLELCMRLVSNETLEPQQVLDVLKDQVEMFMGSLDPDYDGENGTSEELDPESAYEELDLEAHATKLGGVVHVATIDQENEKTTTTAPPAPTPILTGSQPPSTNSPSPLNNENHNPPSTPTPAVVRPTIQTFSHITSIVSNKSNEAEAVKTPIKQITVAEIISSPVPASSPPQVIQNSPMKVAPLLPVMGITPVSNSPTIKQQMLSIKDEEAPRQVLRASQTDNTKGTPLKNVLIEETPLSLIKESIRSESPVNNQPVPPATNKPVPPVTPANDVPLPTVESQSPPDAEDTLRQIIRTTAEVTKGPTLKGLIPSWLGASPLGRTAPSSELDAQVLAVDQALMRCPPYLESERPRCYLPKLSCSAPSYYPASTLAHVDTLEYYLRLAPETLFFAFYYMEGSRAQLLAAKALKRLSWRFHTKYLMWFQRHEEPNEITNELERGTYVYFDYEKWLQRKKESFVFEYRYLEDKDFD
ncbi:unnamed protein product, partial [Mesorhabditis belari]|uniref:CCR4-NOT transcription complex subunit 3 n=1 Tax=Mesorhabditis belari TaxID=2138241 RepID=A0AAF3EP00_9BILA